MAVYFDKKLDCTGPSDVISQLKWCESGEKILALSAHSNDIGVKVIILNKEGETLHEQPMINSAHVSILTWHPHSKILAIGWENGKICIWNEQNGIFECPHIHKGELTILQWSYNGSHIVSGDNSGVMMIWHSDARGRLVAEPVQHHLQEPINQMVLQPPNFQVPSMNITKLSRAAVHGDKNALDMFSQKQNGGYGNSFVSHEAHEAFSFFVGGASGGVYHVQDSTQCRQCINLDHSILKLMFYEAKNVLVSITDNLTMSQHAISGDGQLSEILKVKLSGRTEHTSICWAGEGILALASGEMVVRLWDLEHSDNYVLNLEGHCSYDSNESLFCVGFCEEKGLLAAGTNMGNIALWKFSAFSSVGTRESEELWILQAPATVDGPVRSIEWCRKDGLLAVSTVSNAYILSQQRMSSCFNYQTAVVQYAPSAVSILFLAAGVVQDLKTDIQIKGICTTKDALAVWNGKKALIYEYSSDKSAVNLAGQFMTDSMLVVMYKQNIYSIERSKVYIRTFQGTVKQLLTFSEGGSNPVSLDVCGHYLAVATDTGTLFVYDISLREAKVNSNTMNLAKRVNEFHSIISARVNCSGSRVSVTVRLVGGHLDSKLYVWDVELNTLHFFNFKTGFGEQDDNLSPGKDESDDICGGKMQLAKYIAGRYPVSHHWDRNENKLLVCEAIILNPALSTENGDLDGQAACTLSAENDSVGVMVVSLFASSDHGILIQDAFLTPAEFQILIGVEVPYFYFVRKPIISSSTNDGLDSRLDTIEPHSHDKRQVTSVSKKYMRDFIGLENSDKPTCDAMMNFSFHLTTGNMDEAFKSIKLIKSEPVWENMAKMCVRSRRLDVASVCLGNMGHARGAKALREVMAESDLDARVAVLAVQLGMHEDAERLLKNCHRFDLLNEFYQNCGQWENAIKIAETYDRIHLRTTYYNYARHLEGKGDTTGAILNFEKSQTHQFEVPRMLIDEPEQLENYISNGNDKALHRWWAQYMESTGDMEAAVRYYEKSQDFFSLVRVHCYCSDMQKAAAMCNDTSDRAACYYLARQYENLDRIKEAIHFFTRAQAIGSAIRLCKEHGYEDQLLSLALQGRPADMMDAARYYEQRSETIDKAVMLYHKAGNIAKALDLAFTTKQFAALQLISNDLNENTDPQLLQRCANFLIQNDHHDKAVNLLALGKKYREAIKICMEQHVEITEELAERLTPRKDDGVADCMDRIKLLECLADVCMQQGQYHLATKKFTQAGSKLKAMKALLKSGDTEKIIFFAGVSRQKEIYIMAANYLQSLDWQKDPEIMMNIIGFYTKGHAFGSLASFYESCCQVEIDDYQNYDKALGALGEAHKCISKSQADELAVEDRLCQLKHKMGLIKKFTSARRSYADNQEDAVKQCQVLLDEVDLENAVRVGDVYAFLIEHYASKQRWKAAYAALDELRSKVSPAQVAFYVNADTVHMVHRALNLPPSIPPAKGFSGLNDGRRNDDTDGGDIVSEEVMEEVPY